MAYRSFVLPILGPSPAEDELNLFLRTHQILNVERRWLEQGAASLWCFCVDRQPEQQLGFPSGPQLPQTAEANDGTDHSPVPRGFSFEGENLKSIPRCW